MRYNFSTRTHTHTHTHSWLQHNNTAQQHHHHHQHLAIHIPTRPTSFSITRTPDLQILATPPPCRHPPLRHPPIHTRHPAHRPSPPSRLPHPPHTQCTHVPLRTRAQPVSNQSQSKPNSAPAHTARRNCTSSWASSPRMRVQARLGVWGEAGVVPGDVSGWRCTDRWSVVLDSTAWAAGSGWRMWWCVGCGGR